MVPGSGQRFVVKMEVYAAAEAGALCEDDLDADHMDEVSQLLQDIEDGESIEDETTPTFKKMRYDLCPVCHKKFLRDPLNRDAIQKFDFSEN
jgi:hypothetical protein